jgi:hypothetical protein
MFFIRTNVLHKNTVSNCSCYLVADEKPEKR